jgi:hypothetical protein
MLSPFVRGRFFEGISVPSILPTVFADCANLNAAYSVFERSGYRFASRKRVETKDRASVLIQSEPKML